MLGYIFSLNTLWWLILLIYIPSCIGLIIVVLLQKGKGVGFAGAFGAGTGAETIFGPRSSRSLPQRITYTMAGLFMLLALVMSTLSGQIGKGYAPTVPVDEETAEAAGMDELFEGEQPGDRPLVDPDAPGAEGPVQLPILNQDPSEVGTVQSTGDTVVEVAPPADTVSELPATEESTSVDLPAEAPLSVEATPAPADGAAAPEAGAATDTTAPAETSATLEGAAPAADAAAESPAPAAQ